MRNYEASVIWRMSIFLLNEHFFFDFQLAVSQINKNAVNT